MNSSATKDPFKMTHRFKLFLIIVLVISGFSLFFVSTFHSFILDANSIRAIKEQDINEKRNLYPDNPDPISEAYPSISFVNRVKRETKDNFEKIPVPAAEITKSSQQIQFSPGLYAMGQPQFSRPYYVPFPTNAAATTSSSTSGGFSQFQQSHQQQPMMHLQVGTNNQMMQSVCFMAQSQPPYPNAKPYYCTYIPMPPTFQFPVVPGITDFSQAMLGASKGSKEQENVARAELANPYEHLLKEYIRECPVNFYRCNDGSKCISKLKWCDNQIDCADASDETKCSCRDRIGREKLCDNYHDCPHGEDELGCFGCPKDSFSCNDESISLNSQSNCVLEKQRCDGIRQCTNGKDEELCSILTESYVGENEMYPVSYNVGFLKKNCKGIWYQVCGHASTWAKDACVAELGFISGDPKLEMVILPNHREVGPFLMQNDDNSGKIVQDCPTQLTHVRCPGSPSDIHTSNVQVNPSSSIMSSNKNISNESDPIVGIIGGVESLPGTWPFIIAINQNGHFHCGGVIVSEWWVLSAAHCFSKIESNYYEIEAGMLRRLSFSPNQQIRRIHGVIIHPSYDTGILKNDIAMGLLAERVYFNSWVRPVRLPKSDLQLFNWLQEPSPGNICVAVGWGATTEEGPNHDHLREVSVPVTGCKRLGDINEAEICAGTWQGGRDACQGDSGGPLMCRLPEPQIGWYIGGLVSHGVGCGRPLEPGAYTKVSHFVHWIKSIIYSPTTPVGMRLPRTVCPGFSCNHPHARCLPLKKRCDEVSDCLESEDEINCPAFGKVLWTIVGASHETTTPPSTFQENAL